MQITSYINNDVSLPTLQDGMEAVFNYFEKNTYTHMPLVRGNELLGNIAETDVQGQGYHKNAGIENYLYATEFFFVRETANWVTVLETFSKNETNIMPVLDEHDNYLGYYDLVDVMILFQENSVFERARGHHYHRKRCKRLLV